MTNANKKPGPLYPSTARTPCPVCGQPSYSHEGIHPQCAMHVADQIHINRLRAGQFGQPAPDVEKTAEQTRTGRRDAPEHRDHVGDGAD